MTSRYERHLDESIQLELNLARLYTLFHDSFEEDEEFWWQLAIEERGHAALLQQEKKQLHASELLQGDLLASDLESLEQANAAILSRIEAFRQELPSRAQALETALELELSAGESHYQNFLDRPTQSPAASLFKQLNQEDRDHAERIKRYIEELGITEGNG